MLLCFNVYLIDVGCFCNVGDCGNCLVSVGGEVYFCSCQVCSVFGMVVECSYLLGEVFVMEDDGRLLIGLVRYLYCDVVVIGGGSFGFEVVEVVWQSGYDVIVFDVGVGQEVFGIYLGLVVVVRIVDGMFYVYLGYEIVIVIGVVEIQFVCLGNWLCGFYIFDVVCQFYQWGFDLGCVVYVGGDGLMDSFVEYVDGEFVWFDGEDGQF